MTDQMLESPVEQPPSREQVISDLFAEVLGRLLSHPGSKLIASPGAIMDQITGVLAVEIIQLQVLLPHSDKGAAIAEDIVRRASEPQSRIVHASANTPIVGRG